MLTLILICYDGEQYFLLKLKVCNVSKEYSYSLHKNQKQSQETY